MSSVTKEQMKEWVEAWKRAGPAMEVLRRQELQADHSPLSQVLQSFNEVFDKAVHDNPPGESSGLIEQQRLFKRLHPA